MLILREKFFYYFYIFKSILEKDLLIKLKEGSEKSFNPLFHRYEKYCKLLIKTTAFARRDAEKVVQEFFVT